MAPTKANAWRVILSDCPWLRAKPLDIAIAEYRAAMRQEREYYGSIWDAQTYDDRAEEAN